MSPQGGIPAWWAVLMVMLACFITAGLSVTYTVHSRHESERRWCDLLATIDTPQPNSPPRTPQEVRSRKVGREIHILRARFGCH